MTKHAPCACYPQGNDGDCPAPGCRATSLSASRSDEVQEWIGHMNLHLTEHDLPHAGKALRAAWPHVMAYLLDVERERDTWRELAKNAEAAIRSERGTSDGYLALNSALERESVRKTVKDIETLALEGRWEQRFQAGLQLACEEIEFRLEILWGERPDTPDDHPLSSDKDWR